MYDVAVEWNYPEYGLAKLLIDGVLVAVWDGKPRIQYAEGMKHGLHYEPDRERAIL